MCELVEWVIDVWGVVWVGLGWSVMVNLVELLFGWLWLCDLIDVW